MLKVLKLHNIFAIMAILGLLFLIVAHEEAHVEIYRHYGIDSQVYYFESFPEIYTQAEEACPTDNCILANNLNEVVGYPMLILYLIWAISVYLKMLQSWENKK